MRSGVTLEAMGVLLRCDWPGNVRELANVLERAQTLAISRRALYRLIAKHHLEDPHPGAGGGRAVSSPTC